MIAGRPGLLPLLVATFAVYGGVVTATYAWDDAGTILHNRALSEPSLATIFGRDFWCCTDSDSSPYYRPLATVSLLLDRTILGGSPALAHLHSLTWHALATACAYLLVERAQPRAALAAATLFALHPIQSEAVTWLSARNDVQAGALVLAGLCAADRGRLGLVALLSAAAALTKEFAYLAPGLGALWWLGTGRRPRAAILGAQSAGILVALLLRAQATLGAWADVSPMAPVTLQHWAQAAAWYLGWLSLPWPLTSMATAWDAPPVTILAGAAATILLGLWALHRQPVRALALLAFAALAFAPSLYTLRALAMLGERYLYLASFGWVALLSTVLLSPPPSARSTRAIVPALALGGALAILVRTPEWRDSETLFRAATARLGGAFAPRTLGNWLHGQGRDAEAYALLVGSLRATPRVPFACTDLAAAAAGAGKLDELLSDLPEWEAAGCRDVRGFDDDLFYGLALTGRWDALGELLPSQRRGDGTYRSTFARGAYLWRIGDQVGTAAVALRYEPGAGSFRAQVEALSRK